MLSDCFYSLGVGWGFVVFVSLISAFVFYLMSEAKPASRDF